MVSTSMTLNAVIALVLRFLLNSTDFQADYITVVEDRPSGAGTNLKVGGTGPARSAGKIFFTVPPHFSRVPA